jgi:hypothetical protein
MVKGRTAHIQHVLQGRPPPPCCHGEILYPGSATDYLQRVVALCRLGCYLQFFCLCHGHFRNDRLNLKRIIREAQGTHMAGARAAKSRNIPV